jgi:hypothetical protein
MRVRGDMVAKDRLQVLPCNARNVKGTDATAAFDQRNNLVLVPAASAFAFAFLVTVVGLVLATKWITVFTFHHLTNAMGMNQAVL